MMSEPDWKALAIAVLETCRQPNPSDQTIWHVSRGKLREFSAAIANIHDHRRDSARAEAGAEHGDENRSSITTQQPVLQQSGPLLSEPSAGNERGLSDRGSTAKR